MKTRQEQIDEIQEIIGDNYEFDSINAALGSGDGDINIEEAAKAIVEAGYGDVSEYKNRFEVTDKVLIETKAKLTKAEHDRDRYKAEIESLKAENEAICKQIKRAYGTGYNDGYERHQDEIKQAKIDVLDKVRTLIFQKDNPYNVPFEEFISANVFCGYIDELIKEVEND